MRDAREERGFVEISRTASAAAYSERIVFVEIAGEESGSRNGSDFDRLPLSDLAGVAAQQVARDVDDLDLVGAAADLQ
jgi:hypothetical protein